MNRPRVSVVVPNYNYGRFLRGRIDSILSQTVSDIEIILIDDASTDDSHTVIATYADDPRVQIIVNERNHGSPFYSWNLGVARATAEYVWIAESDDLADHRFLERLIPVLDNHQSVGLVYCQSLLIDERDCITGSLAQWMSSFDSDRWRTDFIENGRYESRTMFCRFCEIANVSSAVFRRDAYVMTGGADESLRLTGDWKQYLKMLRHWDLAYVAETLNQFRTHNSSARSVAALSGRDIIEKYSLAASMYPLLELSPSNRRTAYGDLLKSWIASASTLWSRDHKALHREIFETARAVDSAVTNKTLSKVYSTCGFAALQHGDQISACLWFIDASRHEWRMLTNRGILAVIVRNVLRATVVQLWR